MAGKGGKKKAGKSTSPKSPRGKGKGADPILDKRPTLSQPKAQEALGKLRVGISGLDKKLVKLLNERAELVVEVGKVKRRAGLPIYTPHREAAKCVLISFDSTIKSNISVGLPIEVLWYPKDSLRVGIYKRIVDGDPYFTMLRQGWGGGLRRVFGELPNPDWLA